MSITSKDLEEFVVNCQPKLDVIRTSLNAFNIFNVLGVHHREIRHSNFLGWLFDPMGSHQLDDVFLKGLLKIIRDVNVLKAQEYVSLILKDLSNTKVYRETMHNIDILIVNKEHKFVIIIENKIYAGYALNQLSKYYEYVEENYSEFGTRIYLTLTPEENDSHLEFDNGVNYTNINYQNIIDLLEAKRQLIESKLSTVKESINQYIDVVKKDITKTSKEVTLAKEIYKTYKKEIDFIVSNQENFALYKKDFLNILENEIQGLGLSHKSDNRNVIYLLPTDQELRQLFKFPSANSRGGDFIFSLVLQLEKEAVWLKFAFGNIEDCSGKSEIQAIKEKQFNEMRGFECFNNSDLKVNFHRDSAQDAYPGICGVPLFNDEMYFESKNDIKTLFKERFEEINKELIQPWVKECIETFNAEFYIDQKTNK